jgi:hypothetical protein
MCNCCGGTDGKQSSASLQAFNAVLQEYLTHAAPQPPQQQQQQQDVADSTSTGHLQTDASGNVAMTQAEPPVGPSNTGPSSSQDADPLLLPAHEVLEQVLKTSLMRHHKKYAAVIVRAMRRMCADKQPGVCCTLFARLSKMMQSV